MIIDLIIVRKDRLEYTPQGDNYSPKKFYDDVMGYYNSFPEIVLPLANALDSGEENDVRKALANYIINQNYSIDLVKWIFTKKWL